MWIDGLRDHDLPRVATGVDEGLQQVDRRDADDRCRELHFQDRGVHGRRRFNPPLVVQLRRRTGPCAATSSAQARRMISIGERAAGDQPRAPLGATAATCGRWSRRGRRAVFAVTASTVDAAAAQSNACSWSWECCLRSDSVDARAHDDRPRSRPSQSVCVRMRSGSISISDRLGGPIVVHSAAAQPGAAASSATVSGRAISWRGARGRDRGADLATQDLAVAGAREIARQVDDLRAPCTPRGARGRRRAARRGEASLPSARDHVGDHQALVRPGLLADAGAVGDRRDGPSARARPRTARRGSRSS